MLNAITTIGMNVSKALTSVARQGRKQAIIAAAVAATGLFAASQASAYSDVTSITTMTSTGTVSTVSGVSGYGDANTGFTPSNSYNLNYQGKDEAVTSVTTSTGTYLASGLANAVVRRTDTGSNTDIIWYQGTGGPNSSNLTLNASPVSNFSQAFSGNNLLVGTDNLFANSGNTVGNDTNVERLDVLFPFGFQASSSNAFAVFDRGNIDQHDPFKIAAITSVDPTTGAPTSYGPLLTFALGTWGNNQLTPAETYIVTRRDDSITGDTYHPSDEVVQSMGAVLVNTSDLATAGSTIYGYSIFAGDTNGSGNDLLNWKNPTYFPENTTASGLSASTDSGGLDAIGTAAVLYSVPEPTSATLMLLGMAGLMVRRNKRKLA